MAIMFRLLCKRWSVIVASVASVPRLRPLDDSGARATVGLVAVLVMLPVFAFIAAWTSYDAGKAAKHAGEISEAYDEARYCLGTEESLERKYRLDPGTDVRQAYAHAAASLDSTLQHLLMLEPREASAIDRLLQDHKAYLSYIERMFAAIDVSDKATVSEIDEEYADPLFSRIEQEIFKAAGARRIQAMEQLSQLARIQRAVFIGTPIAFGIALAFVIFFAAELRRYRVQTVEATLLANRRNERRLHALVKSTSDAIFLCDATGAIFYQVPTMGSDSWGPNGNLSGTPLADLIHPKDEAALTAIWLQATETVSGTGTVELRVRNVKDTWHHVECSVTNLSHEDAVGGFVVTLRDLNERKIFEKQLTKQAFHDVLTGLPNRALLQDRVERALARASRRQAKVGLIFIDLDNFKRVNDSLGHRQGDTLLVEAARRLEDCIRPSDTVARLGGDEFVILLDRMTGEDGSDATSIARRILEQFEIPFMLEGRGYVVSASIGIALTNTGTNPSLTDADTLLRNADVAMYRAKSNGKARYMTFDSHMRLNVLDRLTLEADLRQAVERNELRVHFQPIVHLQSEQVREVEALVRWQHPERGLIGPAEFIPIAEETGLIIPIGRYVLQTACQHAAIWQAKFPQKPPIQISVNLSPRQFDDPSLVDDVMDALRLSAIQPGSLKLEVTESVIMRDAEASIRTLHKLKAQGIKIAIDDFGTGYSSLSYLRTLPLDVLKIDRSFVKGIGTNSEDDAIVQAIISLARSLDLDVTAEGIETDAQVARLREWSCKSGQGFLFSKPLQSAQVMELLRKREGSPSFLRRGLANSGQMSSVRT